MRYQQAQAFAHPTSHSTALAAPKQAVVHKDTLRAFVDGALNERQAGGHAAYNVAHLVSALYL